MKYIIVAILVLCSLSVDAQEKPKGFYNITEIGFLKGVGRIDGSKDYLLSRNSNRLRTQFGAFINESWSVGLGIGYDRHSWISAMPAFVDVHYYFKEKPYFFFLDLGYSIPWESAVFEGIMADVGAGVRLKIKKKNWLISVSHNSQQLKGNILIYSNSSFGLKNVPLYNLESIIINSFSINLGLLLD